MDKFAHKHSFGQNFLKDKNVLMKMIDSVDVKEDDLVIEIGPGQGALTKYLKLFHCQLVCFEIDTRLKKYLDNFVDDKTEVIFEDILKVNLEEVLSKYKYNNLYVIANLPYYITTPIIEHIMDSKLKVKSMLFMVQNEVADRLCAKAGSKDYGYISAYLSYFYDVNKVIFVPRKCFEPVPNVDSAVIKLDSKTTECLVSEDNFNKLLKDSFRMKRKNIRNNLSNYDLSLIETVLSKYGLTLQDRAEQVPVECFVEIANLISK